MGAKIVFIFQAVGIIVVIGLLIIGIATCLVIIQTGIDNL